MRIVYLTFPRHRPARTSAGLAVLGAAALLATGCGTHLIKVRSSVLRLRIDEYSITPQDVEVHAGRLKLIAFNTGILTHNVRVESDRPGSSAVLGTDVVPPGQSRTAKLTLTPGSYRLVDTIANHAALGDYGTLTVVK